MFAGYVDYAEVCTERRYSTTSVCGLVKRWVREVILVLLDVEVACRGNEWYLRVGVLSSHGGTK
jgi:hypothetical protein